MSHSNLQHNLVLTKSKLRKNYSKKFKRNNLVLTQNVIEIDKTESKKAKSVDNWEIKLKAYLMFLDKIIFFMA